MEDRTMGFDVAGIGSVADLASGIIGRLWPDKTQQEKDQMAQAMALLQGQISMNQAQLDVDKAEAANSSLFVSGWRPFVGWTCGGACAWNWVFLPMTNAISAMIHHPLALAPADLSQMLPLLMGMLGMGALRTYEKTQGVARS
jgi:Holin of 3TMs, for gene-transfer release